MSVVLRPYQKEVYNKAIDILSFRNVVYLACDMRTGKTLTSLSIAEFFGGSVLFVTKLKAIEGIQKDIEAIGMEKAVTIVNYESLHKHTNREFDTIIVDEAHCFKGDTLIDGLKIKLLKVGDSVKSYNFDKNIIEEKRVLNVFKNKVNKRKFVKISFNGKYFVCTEDHKIYTKNGWKKARDITTNDELLIV